MSAANLDHEYAPIGGSPEFCKVVAQLAFGDNDEIVKNNLVGISSTSAHQKLFPERITKKFKKLY